MSNQLNIKNIKNYLEGRANQALSSLDLKPESFIEQINYRKSKCQDCLSKGRCEYCGCAVPGRLYSTASCNKGEKFPDIMNDEEWVKFKQTNNEEFS